MSILCEEMRVPSSDGIHTLVGRVYRPEGRVRGLFHVVHGMTEHIARYDPLFRRMAEDGYLCFGYDHLGHGATARDAGELGYIADRDGWRRLAQDVAGGGVCEGMLRCSPMQWRGAMPHCGRGRNARRTS